MICPRCQHHQAAALPGQNIAHCERCGAVFDVAGVAVPRIGSQVLGPRVVAPAAGAYAELPLVDQDHPLRRLRAAWRACRDGMGQMVSLVGEVGSGRSRLIRELGRAVDEQSPGALWIAGQAHSYATYSAFGLLADLLAPWSGDAVPTGVPAALEGALVALATGASEQHAARLLAVADQIRAAGNAGAAPVDDLAAVLAEALSRAAGGQLLVLVIEDLEWADAASLAVLDALLPRLLSGLTLVACTHHADWSHEWPNVARHYHLILGSLAQDEARRLAALAQEGAPFLEDLVEAVVAKSGGNPLQLEQAVYAVREQLPELDDGDDPLALVPETLQEAILARIAALPAAVRDVLVAAAVLGQSFTHDAVAAVAGESADLDGGLRELARRRLVVRWREEPAVTYRFAHGFIQEVAYGSLHRGERQVLEARVADWLLRDSALHGVSADQVIDDLATVGPADASAPPVIESPRAPAMPPADAAEVTTPPPASEPPPTPSDAAAAPAPVDTVTAIWPMTMQQGRRNAVLARIALGDLTPDRRASVVLCLQHGYSYRAAGELLGLPTEEVRAHLYEARQIFKRLYEASEAAAGRKRDGAR